MIKLNNDLILAPLAGVNCTSFRLLCKKYGAGLIYTQMYEVSTIIELKDNLKGYLNILEIERPISIQLVGSLNDDWENAVKLVEPFCDIIDINFGCIESRILGKKGGCYLMKHPDQLMSVFTKVKKSTKKPVSTKLRLGWDNINVLELSQQLDKNGVDLIAIHARTKQQKYSGKANWNLIKKVKENVNVPIAANGDVFLHEDIKKIKDFTKCDYVMIGRGAMKNPAIFSKKFVSKKILIKEFIDLYLKYEKRQSLNEVKEHCMRLITGEKNLKEYKEKFIKATTIEQLKSYV